VTTRWICPTITRMVDSFCLWHGIHTVPWSAFSVYHKSKVSALCENKAVEKVTKAPSLLVLVVVVIIIGRDGLMVAKFLQIIMGKCKVFLDQVSVLRFSKVIMENDKIWRLPTELNATFRRYLVRIHYIQMISFGCNKSKRRYRKEEW